VNGFFAPNMALAEDVAPTLNARYWPASPIAGQLVSIGALATDDYLLANTNLYLNDVNVKTCDFSGQGFASADCSFSTITLGVGLHTYYAVTTDSAGNTTRDPLVDTKSFTVVAAPNNPPVLAPIGAQSVDELAILSFTATATDVENDALAYSLADTVPDGASIDSSTGVFTWTPTEAQGPGSYTFDVVVIDSNGGTDSETITVTVSEVNVAPTANDQSVTTNEDTATAITLTATDTDLPANTLTYTVSNPSNGALSGTAPNLTYTPNANYNGSDSFTFTVSDDGGTTNSAPATVSITITAVNDAPEITLTAPVGGEIWSGNKNITWIASDIDVGDTLTITIQESIDGIVWTNIATGESNDGTYLWNTASVSDGATYLIKVMASDSITSAEDISGAVFTTDNTVPSVIEGSLSPVKDAVGVALDATISLAFSEKVSIGSVVVKNDTTSVETTISGSGISFNDTTNTATITLPVETLQSNTVYIVTVNNIQDEAGNIIASYGSDNSWKFTTATGYSINLISGWNLISLPVTPTTWRSIPNTLATVSGKVNRIWTYDAPNAKWLVYNTDLSVPSDTNFTSLEAGRGYWIEMNAGGVLVGSGTLYEQLVPSGGQPSNQLPQVQLAEGWNMIGYYQLPGKTTAPIENALSKLAGAWSGEGNDIITFTPNTLQPLTPKLTMTPGEGYWIYMNNAKKYSFGNGNFQY